MHSTVDRGWNAKLTAILCADRWGCGRLKGEDEGADSPPPNLASRDYLLSIADLSQNLH